MSFPADALVALRTATEALLAGLDAERWTPADLRAPSVLPGWTRGHVLAHLARNADAITRTLSGALRGEIVNRYPNGPQGRAADIEAGATRDFTELAADIRESADRLDRLFVAVDEANGWDLPTQDRPASQYVAMRWREVEIHRADLAGSYTAAEWPVEFVATVLPELADALASRVTVAMRVEVAEAGSTARDLVGRVWTVGGAGDPVHVTGPDWALLAWLVGRPPPAPSALAAAPDLPSWL